MERDESYPVLVAPWSQRSGLGTIAIGVSQWTEAIAVLYRIDSVYRMANTYIY